MTESLVTGIVQIGIVVPDVRAAVEKYRELLGLDDWSINFVDTHSGKGRHFRRGAEPTELKATIAWMNLGGVELEIIEPQDEDSVYAEFLRQHGPGVHHVMFGTSDYDESSRRMAKVGIPLLGSGELQETRFQLLDARDTLGVIFEIADGDPLRPDERP